jgi:HK97 gp10 family phage protein
MIELGKIQGLAEVKEVFKQLPVEIARKALRGAMLDGAEVIRKEAQRLAPIRAESSLKKMSKRKLRKAGFLKASIMKRMRARPREGDMTVSVGWSKDAFYGSFIEFGTRFITARPFLRPALDSKATEASKRIATRLGPQINNIIKRLARRRKR